MECFKERRPFRGSVSSGEAGPAPLQGERAAGPGQGSGPGARWAGVPTAHNGKPQAHPDEVRGMHMHGRRLALALAWALLASIGKPVPATAEVTVVDGSGRVVLVKDASRILCIG